MPKLLGGHPAVRGVSEQSPGTSESFVEFIEHHLNDVRDRLVRGARRIDEDMLKRRVEFRDQRIGSKATIRDQRIESKSTIRDQRIGSKSSANPHISDASHDQHCGNGNVNGEKSEPARAVGFEMQPPQDFESEAVSEPHSPEPFTPKTSEPHSPEPFTPKTVYSESGLARDVNDEARKWGSTGSAASLVSRRSIGRVSYIELGNIGKIKRVSTQHLELCIKNAGLQRTVKSRWVINPNESVFMERWDTTTTAALLFTALVTPFQVAMSEVSLDALFIVNCVIDCIFYVDMCLQFFLMYQTRTSYGGSVLEYRHAAIVRNYMRTWFIVDLISCIPFDAIALLTSWFGKMKVIKVIRLLRLVKLLRILKASRILRRYELRMSFSYQRFALVKFFLVLAFITHWMACFWALTLQIVEPDSGVPRWIDSFDELEENLTVKTKNTPWKLYVACLYFTCYTITSVGYGDIGPKNMVERLMCIFMIVSSGTSWAVVLGQVSSVMSSMSEEELGFRKLMDTLNSMMEDRQLNPQIRLRLRSFFLQNRVAKRYQAHTSILNSLSRGLRSEVMLELNKVWFYSVSFLREILERAEEIAHLGPQGAFMRFIADLSQKMVHVAHAQRDMFGTAHTLYILKRGICSRQKYSCERSFGRIFRSGATIGTDFVLSNPILLDDPETFAMTYAETIELAYADLADLVQSLNEGEEVKHYISRTIRRYAIRLAIQRAGILLARKKKYEQSYNES